MQKLNPLMFVGTGSDVGKSIINTALCRILLQDGYSPAPFKAQNMSLNSYATPEDLEIGRAQAVQAEACGIECSVEMNPVLLKPTGDMHSQVVLNGKPVGNQSAKEYFLGNNKAALFDEVVKAYRKLEDKFNPIVLEGAGSISEINLWDKDITNMRMAREINAATYLVSDIDRGGVFASVYGSIVLLPEEERRLIKGIIINKFRGDIDLFKTGKEKLEELTGVPVVGIVPYFNHIKIEEEDSVSLLKKNTQAVPGKINVAVVLLKHLSNFTDFNRFTEIEQINLYFSNKPGELSKTDILIIPGSKNTISDMKYLQDTGIDKCIVELQKQGKSVIGICGGYQIMGEKIHDPHQVEGKTRSIDGLGILPVVSELTPEKKSRQCNFTFRNDSEQCQGYEIHMGSTNGNTNPVCMLDNGLNDGHTLSDNTWGCYIHGIFDNATVLQYILQPYLDTKIEIQNYFDFKEVEYNKLADYIRQHIDLPAIYKELKK